MLAEVEVNQKDVKGWYNLHDCTTCTGGDKCKEVPGRSMFGILGYDNFPTCPIRLLRSPHWQHVVQLYNAKTVSPLTGWPSHYAAWIVDALCELEAAFTKKQAASLKSSKGASRGGNQFR